MGCALGWKSRLSSAQPPGVARAGNKGERVHSFPSINRDELITPYDATVAPGVRIGIPADAGAAPMSRTGASVTAHRDRVPVRGVSVDPLVHDHAAAGQPIADLAIERNSAHAVSQIRTTRRCLDNALGDAMAAVSVQRGATLSRRRSADDSARPGRLAACLRVGVGRCVS